MSGGMKSLEDEGMDGQTEYKRVKGSFPDARKGDRRQEKVILRRMPQEDLESHALD
jgi:hypothetical protein